MIYFTSDWHLGHKKILEYEPSRSRIWNTVEEMNEGIIQKYNDTVNDEDTVYFLGDIFWCGKTQARMFAERLRGKKVLVKGNHDQFPDSFYLDYFENVLPYAEINYKSVYYILFHYPIEEWNGKQRDSIHLHGHLHSEQSPMRNRFNICVENTDFHPISIEKILELRQVF